MARAAFSPAQPRPPRGLVPPATSSLARPRPPRASSSAQDETVLCAGRGLEARAASSSGWPCPPHVLVPPAASSLPRPRPPHGTRPLVPRSLVPSAAWSPARPCPSRALSPARPRLVPRVGRHRRDTVLRAGRGIVARAALSPARPRPPPRDLVRPCPPRWTRPSSARDEASCPARPRPPRGLVARAALSPPRTRPPRPRGLVSRTPRPARGLVPSAAREEIAARPSSTRGEASWPARPCPPRGLVRRAASSPALDETLLRAGRGIVARVASFPARPGHPAASSLARPRLPRASSPARDGTVLARDEASRPRRRPARPCPLRAAAVVVYRGRGALEARPAAVAGWSPSLVRPWCAAGPAVSDGSRRGERGRGAANES